MTYALREGSLDFLKKMYFREDVCIHISWLSMIDKTHEFGWFIDEMPFTCTQYVGNWHPQSGLEYMYGDIVITDKAAWYPRFSEQILLDLDNNVKEHTQWPLSLSTVLTSWNDAHEAIKESIVLHKLKANFDE